MADKSRGSRERAEAAFKKTQKTAHKAGSAMAELEAEAQALREKSARLKSLRLAQEEARAKAAPTGKPAARGKKPTR